jgi:hypothetical protein
VTRHASFRPDQDITALTLGFMLADETSAFYCRSRNICAAGAASILSVAGPKIQPCLVSEHLKHEKYAIEAIGAAMQKMCGCGLSMRDSVIHGDVANLTSTYLGVAQN